MKIKLGTQGDPEWTEINVGSHEILIQECYTGIGIETDQGLFGIAQRDNGIEVILDGKLVWSSTGDDIDLHCVGTPKLFRLAPINGDGNV